MAERRTTRRRFTAEFKTQAVKRVLDSGKPLVEVASELGVSTGQLSTLGFPPRGVEGWDQSVMRPCAS